MKRYERIASLKTAIRNCEQSGNTEWHGRHSDRLDKLMDTAPSGSGFDSGTTLADDPLPNRLIFETAFHHIADAGYYDGWTEHRVTVSPAFIGGFDVHVSGRDRNGIKDYIAETFQLWLSEDAPEEAP